MPEVALSDGVIVAPPRPNVVPLNVCDRTVVPPVPMTLRLPPSTRAEDEETTLLPAAVLRFTASVAVSVTVVVPE